MRGQVRRLRGWPPGHDPDERARPGPRFPVSFDVGGGHIYDRETKSETEAFGTCDGCPNPVVEAISAYDALGTLQVMGGYKARWFQAALAAQLTGQHLFLDRATRTFTMSPPDVLYFQPRLLLRAGWSPIFVEGQAGVWAALLSGKASGDTQTDGYDLTIGLALDLDRLGQGKMPFDWNFRRRLPPT